MSLGRLSASCLLLALLAAGAAPAAELPGVAVDDSAAEYRRIRIAVDYEPDPTVSAFEIWFAAQAFTSTGDAELHSIVRVGDVAGLERKPEGVAFDDCWSGGEPIHRGTDGNPVVSPGTSSWSCALTGMARGAEQWISVVPVSSTGEALVDVDALTPVTGRTDVADERTPPPDTRSVTIALSSVVISAFALLVYLRWSDARRGRSKSRLAHYYVGPAMIALATLTFYPILYGIWLAFTDASQSHLGDEAFIGLANFVTVLTSPGIVRVTLFTLVWAISNVVFTCRSAWRWRWL